MSNIEEKSNPVVFMRCTRGSDPRTEGQKCYGKRAEKMSQDGSSAPMFKCTKCGHVWVVPVGGAFNY